MIVFGKKQTKLDSSCLNRAVFNRSLGSLEVEFKNGGKYEYGCVTPKMYKQLIQAPSKGKFFHQQIRGKLPYRKIEEN
jgi:hypothetical protein